MGLKVAISRWWRRVWAIALSVALPQGAVGDSALDPVKLSNLVRQDCGSCHGLTLQGGLGKPLTVEHLKQWDRSQLIHIILDGVPGTPMPGWRPLLTESEAGWIADALQKGAVR
jgi:cytochrome c55X